jgi:Zn-dependent protease/predicted transcriptional regulator
MRGWSIPAGRLFGTELRVHLTFFVLPLFIWWTEYAAHQGRADSGRDMALAAIVFACVLLHELGHGLVAAYEKAPAKAVVLLPIGGVTMLDDSRLLSETASGKFNWRREIRIAAAGPIFSLIVAVLAGAVIFAVRPTSSLSTWPFVQPSALLKSFVWTNIYLAGLNLLPAYPMDGGRILRALFARTIEPVRATRTAVSIGKTFAVMFMLAGIWNIWLSMVGVLLFIGAQLEERSVMFHSVLETVQMEDIMLTDFATLSPADTLEDALNTAVHSLQDDFPVVRGPDMVGVISKQNILEALRREGNGYVQSAMNRIFDVASRRETLASAFRKLNTNNLSIIPVVENEHLVGIVTLQNLMHSMTLLAESRKLRRTGLTQ